MRTARPATRSPGRSRSRTPATTALVKDTITDVGATFVVPAACDTLAANDDAPGGTMSARSRRRTWSHRRGRARDLRQHRHRPLRPAGELRTRQRHHRQRQLRRPTSSIRHRRREDGRCHTARPATRSPGRSRSRTPATYGAREGHDHGRRRHVRRRRRPATHWQRTTARPAATDECSFTATHLVTPAEGALETTSTPSSCHYVLPASIRPRQRHHRQRQLHDRHRPSGSRRREDR